MGEEGRARAVLRRWVGAAVRTVARAAQHAPSDLQLSHEPE